jgi:adenosine deaminase
MDKKQEIHNMKKVVLHLHLDGSVRPETIQEWLREEGKDVDLDLIKEKSIASKDCKDLNQYLEKFNLPLQFLQSEEKIKRATYELYEDLAKRNVIYAEVRFAPVLHIQKGLSYDQIVESTIAGMNEAKKQFGIDGGLILCAMRNANHEANINTVKSAQKYLGKGIVALDLAGAEALFPTKNFEDIFSLARENNIPFTIHAGEADGPESIRSALQFGAQRIGHGIRCVEDKKLMEELKQKQILLEICPTSNIQTQAVQGKYPLEEIYKFGIPVSINTDNDTVSNTNMDQEYEWVLNNTSFDMDNLIQMNLNSAKYTFTTAEKKEALIKEILN